MTMQRNSNIELLRIISMLGVIVLHYNNEYGGMALNTVNKGSFNFYFLMFIESLFVCAVNVFVMISGYFLSTNNDRRVGKALDLLMQVSVYSILFYLVRVIGKKVVFTWVGFFIAALPVNWFVIIYVALYLISPLINYSITMLLKKMNILLPIFLLVFSFYPTAIDVLSRVLDNPLLGLSTISINGSERGYSIVNFVVCYVIGAVIREKRIEKKYSPIILVTLLIVSVIITTGWALNDDYTAWEYCNPFVLLNAALLLLIFLKFTVKNNKIINKLASSSFTIYIIHAYLISRFHAEKYVNTPYLFIHLIAVVSIIVIVGFFVNLLYSLCFKPLRKRLTEWGKY